LGLYKNLFRQTFIYGIATVLPRLFSFFLVPLYVNTLPKAGYGEVTIMLTYVIFFNVVLAYGMETAFFRFYNKEADKKNVIETATVSVFCTSVLFLVAVLLLQDQIGRLIGVSPKYVAYVDWVLVLDAIVVIPFAKLRVRQRSMFYALVKIGDVSVNLLLNIFFLVYLPKLARAYPDGFFSSIYIEDFQIGYIFLSYIAANLVTFIVLSKNYFELKWRFDFALWKKMMRYGFPVLIAGIAFAINDQFDKLLLEKLLPSGIAKAQVGVYAACYKLGLFMVLYRTAYTLGIEPFFFSHAEKENATQTYATVTKYFVIFGSFIQLAVVVFADIFKRIMIPNADYWEAMKVVPLIILANFFLGIYTNLSVWYKLIDKTHIGAWISVVGAVVTLVLNFWLIPVFQQTGGDGYMGSAIATIAAYGSMMVISYVMGNKAYPIPYDMKRIGGYLALSIAFSVISFYLFRENYLVGSLLLAIFLAVIYAGEKPTLQRIIRRQPQTLP